jgi:signal transduction histidine kinase
MGIWVLDLRSETVARSPLLPTPYEGPAPATKQEFLERVHPDDRAGVEGALADCADGRTPTYERVFRVVRRDGTAQWNESKGQVFRDRNGVPERMAGTIVDVTERVAAEEKIRRLNEGLERTVAERTSALEASNRELEAFAHSVSHDLRAPLRTISGFAQALEEDVGAGLGESGAASLARIRAATERMDELIRSLLNLSRISRSELHRTEVDLSAIASSIGADLARAHPGRTVELVVASGLRADADQALVRVILTNLLENAWKFTARKERPRVEIGATPGEETVYFVRDDGVGFDMAFASKLFGAFQRLHPTREFPGTGLGLATVQRAVHRHGGRVWAESEPDRGAKFSFTLGASRAIPG